MTDMTKLEEEIFSKLKRSKRSQVLKGSTQGNITIEQAKAAAEVAKRYIEKAIRDEQNRIWIYTSRLSVSGGQSLGHVVPMMHIARACNAIGETEKWFKENGVI